MTLRRQQTSHAREKSLLEKHIGNGSEKGQSTLLLGPLQGYEITVWRITVAFLMEMGGEDSNEVLDGSNHASKTS